MDVSWSEAQRAETNVIARSDDRATTMDGDNDRATTMDGDNARATTTNVRTHHGASYRPDGNATTVHRRPRIVKTTFVAAVSTIGRTVVRPYISPSPISPKLDLDK